MGPSALSGGIWKPGIYYYVLCPTSKSLLSRIWTHLVRLAGAGDWIAPTKVRPGRGVSRRPTLQRRWRSLMPQLGTMRSMVVGASALARAYIRPFQGRGTIRKDGGGLAASGCVFFSENRGAVLYCTHKCGHFLKVTLTPKVGQGYNSYPAFCTLFFLDPVR